MENQKLLKSLNGAVLNADWKIINNLISDLQQEILSGDLKGTSSKQRIKKAMSYHKKLLKSTKKILAFTSDDALEGYQVFTDSYFMVALKGDDVLPIPDYKKANELYRNDSKLNPYGYEFQKNYPDVSRIFPKNFVCSFKLYAADLLKACDAYSIIHLKGSLVDLYLASDLLKQYITFMNYSSNDSIDFNFSGSNVRPLLSYHNESKGIILPIVINDKNIKVYEFKIEETILNY